MTVCFMFQKEHRQELSKQSEKNTMKNLIACCGLGFRTEGVKTPFCDKLCPIRQCVLKQGLATCGDCPDRVGGPTVGAVWNSNSEAKSRLLERDR